MVILLAVTAGVLFAAAIYMILRRSLVKILVGLLLLSYAVNLLLFNSADLIPGSTTADCSRQPTTASSYRRPGTPSINLDRDCDQFRPDCICSRVDAPGLQHPGHG